MPLKQTYQDIQRLIAQERRLLRAHPRLWAAFAVIMCIPALYAVIYLGSVWDPLRHLDELPAALVSEDRGVHYRGADHNVGKQLTDQLMSTHPFKFTRYPSIDAARHAVERGDAYFALLIPEDFSASAIPGDSHKPGHLTVYSSQGISYMASSIASRFAGEVAHRLNETLNEKRWQVVLETVHDAQSGLQKLKDGSRQLRDGSVRLNDGAERLQAGAGKLTAGLDRAADGSQRLAAGAGKVADGVNRLTAGMGKVGDAVRTMDSKLPSSTDLDRLADGAHQVAEGNRTLSDGLDRLKDGTGKLSDGTTRLANATGLIPVLGTGAAQLRDGSAQLHAGMTQAAAGGTKLADGSGKVDDGVNRLTTGLKRLGDGIHTMATKLPADSQLTQLSQGATLLADKNHELANGLDRLDRGGHQLHDGTTKLADGSHRLRAGLETLYTAIPTQAGSLEGDAHGLAASVTWSESLVTSVPTNGIAFAPYFIALSLWMGAVMTTFVLHFRRLPESASDTSQKARVIAKAFLPGIIICGQVAIMALALPLTLHLQVPNVFAFLTILFAASFTFLTIVMALLLLFGDAGRLVAIVFLVFQLGAAGGAFPIELSPHLYQRVHPFLPITDVVKALRACLFHAYEGQWWVFLFRLIAIGIGAFSLAWLLGRRQWKFVPESEYGPAIDI